MPSLQTPQFTRKRLLLLATAVFLLIAVSYVVWWQLVAAHYESTDDAYVQGNLVQITPQLAGTVIAIEADDTALVTAGTPLIQLNPADADIALKQATAAFAQTVRQVHTLFVQNDVLNAEIAVRQADLKRAQADLNQARSDLSRRQGLAKSGGVSGEDILHAQTALKTAESAFAQAQALLKVAEAKLQTGLAITHGTIESNHPNVLKAEAELRNAWLAQTRTRLPAPTTGVVARRSVQVGQYVRPGDRLMNIVPLDQIWVDANFKEGQLRHIRTGQSATLTADVYGSRVIYHGRVAGVGAGTGGAFALLPAQNATGNWIKIVQRVPVRIALDPVELKAHPLRLGLSMNVEIDLRQQAAMANHPTMHTAPSLTTHAFEAEHRDVNALIQTIFETNLVP
jgi:membrane fusion protein (multidrug efflux system)